jgi:transposase
MPWKKPKEINLTEAQERILKQFAQGTHIELHLKERSQIILLSNTGYGNHQIERELKTTNDRVIKWRNRYHEKAAYLQNIEDQTPLKLKAEIIKILSDEPRPGAPPKFTDVQVASIIALSLEDPMEIGLPFSHWTRELIREVAIQRGIVEDISLSQIGRFFKRKRFTATLDQRMA